MRHIIPLILTVFSPGLVSGQVIEARLSAEPPLSPNTVERLEANVRAVPTDKETRLRLLRHYRTAFTPVRDGSLPHVLYLIENSPSDPVLSSTLTYVPASETAEHEMVRSAWTRAVDREPANADVLVNAARFLHREHPEDAVQLLNRAVDREPTNKKIAANLGFLYALDLLGMTVRRSPEEYQRLREQARIELDRNRNAFVLAGAGVALPNLFPRTEQARNPNDRSAFDLASSLMARARELSPQEAEFRSPMPLISEFQHFQGIERPQIQPAPTTGSAGVIRVGGPVQAAKLVEKPEVIYPPQAMEARIQGIVRLNVMIGADGRVENATVASGHPLLVPAAMDAVRQYRYQPTLLNGSPVPVISQVEVPFMFQ
jgi:TonB family protein